MSAKNAISLAVLLLLAAQALAATGVGVDQKLGETLDLASFTLVDEDGAEVTLSELADVPVVLTPVYYRCPGVCTPTLRTLARVMGESKLEPGVDYRAVTFSFDPTETPGMAKPKQANMIAEVKGKQVSTDAWRFLTADADTIKRLTGAVGFKYMPDRNGVDFVHTASVVFLSPEGKIVRYLPGTQMTTVDFTMAVVDAAQGNARSFMQKMRRVCFAYDPESRGYVVRVNQIVLGVTTVVVAGFAAALYFMGRKVKPRADRPGAADDAAAHTQGSQS